MSTRWLLCAVCVASCRDQLPSLPPVQVRDSAGIEIVETSAPEWGAGLEWSVDSEPFVSIGDENGDDPYIFDRIQGAYRLPDGSIIVADGGTRQLRAFDSAGHFLVARGRRGPGPAEFSALEGIARCGANEVWVNAGSRISIWSLALEYRREFAVAESIMWPVVCFAGTGLLVKRDLDSDRENPKNTIFFEYLHLMVLDSLGDARNDYLDIPLWEYIYIPKGPTLYGAIHPFGRATQLGPDSTNLVVGYAERLELHIYSRSGALVRIIRGPPEDLQLGSTWQRDFKNADLQGWDQEVRELLESAGNPMPATIPAYTALRTDLAGNFWVRRFELPGGTRNRWAVFAKDGRFLGHLAMPAGLDVYEIGPDYVLGVVADADGVQRVHGYRLRR